jgi:flagellar motor switch protein FliM
MSDAVSPTATGFGPPTGISPRGAGTPAGVPVRRGLRALVGDGSVNQPPLPMLAGIVDRLAGSLAIGFRIISQGSTDARTEQPHPARFAEFMESVPPAALIAVMRIGTWGSHCLAVIDGELANISIGLLLGGQGGPAAMQPRRGYTAIERIVVERLARDQIASGLASAFAPVIDLAVALDHVATDAAEAAIANPPAPCLVWRVSITVEGREGSITFLLPYAAIEPIRAQLSRDPAGSGRDRDAAWRSHLETELPHTDVALRAVIERRRISATEVLRWQVGATVLLNRRHDEPIDVFCDDLLVLRARMAEHHGRIALHVEERRLAEDWPGQT